MIEITFNELPSVISKSLKIFTVPVVNALNKTAKLIEGELQNEMKTVFDKPTPYALRGFRILFAKPGNPESAIKLKDEVVRGGAPALNFLGPQIIGGDRKHKRLEKAFVAAGILNEGSFLIPGKGARKDQFGNMQRQQIQEILAQTRTYRDTQQRSKKKSGRGGNQYFVGRSFDGPGRIVYRGVTGRAIPVLIPVKNVSYKKRFDFFGVVGREFDKNFETIYDQEVLKFAESFIP
jgi:hypothetical protein